MAEELRPSDTAVILSSFPEIDPTAAALGQLQGLGISDEDITVMSSLPYSAEILGRPAAKTRLPAISLVAAVLGLGAGILLAAITPFLYIIRVGGQPIVPIAPTLLLLYEFIMLFLIVGTFGGFLALNRFPRSDAQHYDPELTDGRISLLIHTPANKEAEVVAILEEHGGEVVQEPERRRP